MQTIHEITSDEKIIYSAYVLKPRHQIFFEGPGRTKQSFKAESDINNIMARYLKTGVLEFTQKNEPRYGDVTGFEYQSAMQIVANAKSMFNELPAELRRRFQNEPAQLLAFVQNEANRVEAEEMGLLRPQAGAEEVPATPVAEELPLRAADGTFREQTRAEKRVEAAATKAAKPAEPPADQSTT